MRIIINADDFGMTRSVNRAVVALAKRGTLTSTTVMVNLPFAEEVEQLLPLEHFGIGLHINLTQGHPILSPDRIPTLVGPDGAFLGKAGFERAIRRRQVHSEEVLLEITAQFERLQGLIGARLDHIDSHQGVNKLPPVSAAVREMARQIPQRIGLRVYNKVYLEGNPQAPRLREPTLTSLVSFGPCRVAVETVWRHRARQLRSQYDTHDGLLLSRSHDTVALLEGLANASFRSDAGCVYEVPCHPAMDLEGLPETKLTQSRIDEFRLLNSAPLADFGARGFRLVSYRQI